MAAWRGQRGRRLPVGPHSSFRFRINCYDTTDHRSTLPIIVMEDLSVDECKKASRPPGARQFRAAQQQVASAAAPDAPPWRPPLRLSCLLMLIFWNEALL
jgi:hypothetical protein